MSDFRFSSGYAFNVTVNNDQSNSVSVAPFDQSIRFNRIIDQKPDNPSSVIYSVDAEKILPLLREEDLESLIKITLAGRPVKGGVGMWDVMFNHGENQNYNACVFTARQDYTPITPGRQVIVSQHLNFSFPISRIYLNEISVGDNVGIGIHDLEQKLTYVLFYSVVDYCHVSVGEGELGSNVLPAINCKLQHVSRVEYSGEALGIDIDENEPFNVEAANPFLEHITNVLRNVAVGYPWKPHFTPISIRNINRRETEDRLSRYEKTAIDVSYQDFLNICRQAYRKSKPPRVNKDQSNGDERQIRRRPGARGNQRAQTPERPKFDLPQVEIFSVGHSYIATLDDKSNPDCKTYMFRKDELGKQAVRETFLSNRDLTNLDVRESELVMVLSVEHFGENAFLRYFTINF